MTRSSLIFVPARSGLVGPERSFCFVSASEAPQGQCLFPWRYAPAVPEAADYPQREPKPTSASAGPLVLRRVPPRVLPRGPLPVPLHGPLPSLPRAPLYAILHAIFLSGPMPRTTFECLSRRLRQTLRRARHADYTNLSIAVMTIAAMLTMSAIQLMISVRLRRLRSSISRWWSSLVLATSRSFSRERMRSSWLLPTGRFLDDGLHTAFLDHDFLAFLMSSQHPCQIVQVQMVHPDLACGVYSVCKDSNFIVRQNVRIYAQHYCLVFHITSPSDPIQLTA